MVVSAIDEAQERTKGYLPRIEQAIATECIAKTDVPTALVPHDVRYQGKVRDTYVSEDYIVLVSTDRQSAFDRQLTEVPFKGAVLNQTSAWWFNLTKDLVPNHVIAAPHPNVTIGKKAKVFQVEFVMRGYLTGSTSTSIWKNYEAGVRQYCGHALPDGLKKSQKIPMGNLLTPTTKGEHDELTDAAGVVSSGLMSQEEWDACADMSHKLFARGQEVAAERGLILVDTKYEFGVDDDGKIMIVDEVHTPDSSRYWLAGSYEERLAQGLDPENIDKEFLRKWYAKNCDPYKDETLPSAPSDLVAELSRRYIMLYELITGETF
ncbi:unnamed protein product, partial [Chrysoparadoxa australica]